MASRGRVAALAAFVLCFGSLVGVKLALASIGALPPEATVVFLRGRCPFAAEAQTCVEASGNKGVLLAPIDTRSTRMDEACSWTQTLRASEDPWIGYVPAPVYCHALVRESYALLVHEDPELHTPTYRTDGEYFNGLTKENALRVGAPCP